MWLSDERWKREDVEMDEGLTVEKEKEVEKEIMNFGCFVI